MKPETWSYDGSLESLLVLVAHGLSEGMAPASVLCAIRPEMGLFGNEASWSAYCPPKAAVDVAVDAILEVSRRYYAAVLRAWMSEEALEADLVAVGLDCLRRGETALGDYSFPSLSRLAAAVRQVTKETHLLEGFARFSLRRDGRYVALLEPQFNVLPALAPFFLGRFGAEAFAIVDLVRGFGLASVKKGSLISLESLNGEGLKGVMPEAEEEEEVALWRSYFKTVENVDRRNPDLQRRLMPLRYWGQLTELGSSRQ